MINQKIESPVYYHLRTKEIVKHHLPDNWILDHYRDNVLEFDSIDKFKMYMKIKEIQNKTI